MNLLDRVDSNHPKGSHMVGNAATNQSDQDRFIRLSEVIALTSLKRSAIYRQITADPPTFPRPLKLDQRTVAWSRNKVLDWMSNRPISCVKSPGGAHV
jgi:predicted DNA-binding transcriptional regulator AlpA